MTKPAFTFGTLCSGIESASEAFLPLGAECRYVSEIEPYPCGVLADRHGAGKPMRMPSPDDVTFPEGYDPQDAARFKVLASSLDDDLSPLDRDFVKAWRARAARRAAIKTVDAFPRWGSQLPNSGDLTQIESDELPAVDLLVAGFPCQDFSIAGLRQSLSGARGNLTLYGVRLLHELVRLGRVKSFLYENVPDLLNTKDNAFGAFLGGLVGHDAPIVSPYRGGRWTNAGVADGPLGTAAWRVLDAQYAGVAQRRERVFAFASFGDGPDPVEVLFERQGMSRHPPARSQAGEGVARPLAAGTAGSGGYRNDADTADNLVPLGPQRRAAFGGNRTGGGVDVHTALSASHTASGRQDFETETFIVESDFGGYRQSDITPPSALPALTQGTAPKVSSPTPCAAKDLTQAKTAPGAERPLSPLPPPVAFSVMPMNSGKDYKARAVEVAQPLMAGGPVGGNQGGDFIVQPVAFNLYPAGPDAATHASETELSYALTARGEAAKNGNGLHIAQAVAFSLRGREGGAMPEIEDCDVSPALRAAEGGSTRPFVAFDETQITSKTNRSNPKPGDPCHPLAAAARPPAIADEMAVRRITVVEACRLQGFSDLYTLIEWPTANRKGDELAEQVAYLIGHGLSPERAEILAQTPDGPQYKAIGNSKAVPLVRLIGHRYLAALERRRAAA